jgi:putative holliday junction resolvase
MNNKRKMAIDYGGVRIGIAVSDPLGITARGIETLHRKSQRTDWVLKRIKALCDEFDVDLIIVGLPRRTDGKPGDAVNEVKEFAAALEEVTGLPLIMRDERYTTVIARRIMRDTGGRRSKVKGMADQLAAEILLQDYLDHCNT